MYRIFGGSSPRMKGANEMKRFTLVGMSVGLLFVLAVVVPVYAEATVTEFTLPLAIEVPDTDPCTGEPVTLSITGEAKTRIVQDGSGRVQGTFMLRADLAETTADGEVFQGSTNWNESFGPGRDTFVVNGRILRPGHRSNVIVHAVFHLSPNGMVFDSGEADTCR
jgi:hypothetical protein